MSGYINLATYSAPIELDSSGLEKGLKKMDGDIKTKTDGIAKYLKVGLAGALAAVGTASAGLMAITTKSAEATDQIDKMSQKIGISRQGYQEWDFILSQSGASVDGLQAGMKTLVGRMDEATNGTGKGVEAFARLGLSATDSTGALKSQEQMFEETVIALQNMEDGTEKARLATELFGKQGSELMPLLNGAAGSVEEMKEKAHELGLVLSDEAIDAGVEFTDIMDQTKRMLGSVATQIGVGLMPVIQSFLEWVMEYMPQIQATFSFVFGIMESLVTGFVGIIGDLIEWLKSWYEENQDTVDGIKDSFMDFFSIVTEFFQAFISFASALWNKFGEDIIAYTTTAFEMVQGVLSGAFSVIEGLLKVFTGIFTGDWETFTEGLELIWSGLWEAIKSIVAGAWKLLSLPFRNLDRDIKKWFTDVVKDATNWGRDLVTGFTNGIKDYAMRPVNAAREMANNVANSVKGFFGINSPAKLFIEFGKNLDEGLAQGVITHKDIAINAVKRVGEEMAGLAKSSITSIESMYRSILTPSFTNTAKGSTSTSSNSNSTSISSSNKSSTVVSSKDVGYDAVEKQIAKDLSSQGWVTRVIDGNEYLVPSDLRADWKPGQKFHDGGWVGSMFKNLQHDEVPAILQQGEYVLSRKMINDIANIKGTGSTTQSNNIELKIDNLIRIEGNVDKSTMPSLNRESNNILERLVRELNKHGITRPIKF